jgi:hypothetical protein
MRLAPPLSTGEAPPPDDLDALLQAYFRAEMPQPWPAPPLVRAAEASVKPKRARTVGRSRMALAASVAILVGGTLSLPLHTSNQKTPEQMPRMLPGEATHRPIAGAVVQPKVRSAEQRLDANEATPPRK